VLIPAVSETDSLVPQVVPDWVEADPPAPPLAPPGRAKPRSVARDRPVVLDPDSFSPAETAAEEESPTVLVYDPPAVSVTDSPMVSVSWEMTKRCSLPIWSLAAFASSAFPRRMNATAALPRPIRCRTGGGIDR